MNPSNRPGTAADPVSESCMPAKTGTPAMSSGTDSSMGSRRRFLKTGSALTAGIAGAGLATGGGLVRPLRGAEPKDAAGKDIVRIGIVGMGGRGTGALINTLTINDHVQLVATADINPKAQESLRGLAKFGDKVAVTPDKNHVGIDAYKRVLDDPQVDLVLMATPPGFRPHYVLEAVDAGKHVFAEKPSCVDPAGYRICLQAHEKAIANGTAIVTGTQYRRQTNYVEAIRRIHEGAIGDVINMTARYCSNSIWHKSRPEGMSDTEYQIFNWMHYIWLSGDQIAEQAVHNIDVMNWVMQGPPVSAYGSGGRFTRPEGSEMWDNMSIDYTYPDNRQVSFMCRQIPGSATEVGNVIYGSKGIATILGSNGGSTITDRDGNEIWSMKGDISAAYEQEHKDLVDSIRAGTPIVELKETADSSLTAVMGRVAAYTGQVVNWDFLTKDSQLDLFPKDFDINGARPEPTFAIPGKTKLI